MILHLHENCGPNVVYCTLAAHLLSQRIGNWLLEICPPPNMKGTAQHNNYYHNRVPGPAGSENFGSSNQPRHTPGREREGEREIERERE